MICKVIENRTCLFLALVGTSLIYMNGWQMTQGSMQKLDLVRLSFGLFNGVPDPTNIQTAGQWYFLNHISSPLIGFDFTTNSHSPILASKWEITDNLYTFHLRPDAAFHDGTSIKSTDLVASLKRMMILKTSTHFPLWEYISGCNNLQKIDDECDGIEIIDEHTVRFRLTKPRESFFLQMCCPEGAVWSKDDINPESLELTPTRYSGPYYVADTTSEGELVLKQNTYSPLIQSYPNAPSRILHKPLNRAATEDAFYKKEIDLFIGAYTPLNPIDWYSQDVGIHTTTPSSILYLLNLNLSEGPRVNSAFIEAIWNQKQDKHLIPAETFLPFGSLGAIDKNEFLGAFQNTNVQKKIRIVTNTVYYSDNFLEMLKVEAKKAGFDIEFVRRNQVELIHLLGQQKTEYDFALLTYIASERFPAVQLRYILHGRNLPFEFDLEGLDLIEESERKTNVLRDFQQTLLKHQIVIPLYFARSHIIYDKSLNLVGQPKTDAEIQIWKITKKEL